MASKTVVQNEILPGICYRVYMYQERRGLRGVRPPQGPSRPCLTPSRAALFLFMGISGRSPHISHAGFVSGVPSHYWLHHLRRRLPSFLYITWLCTGVSFVWIFFAPPASSMKIRFFSRLFVAPCQRCRPDETALLLI